MSTCLYLGPAGSFCHQAALLLNENFDLIPAPSEAAIVAAVESGEVEFGLVPIENSYQGEVTATVDNILFNTANLVVRDEIVIPVEFDVFVKPGVTKITKVISHPVALAQCSKYVEANELISESASSTSAAVQAVSQSSNDSIGAIASPITGEMYGLIPFAKGVQDASGARTKFYLLSSKIHVKKPGRQHRTWVALIPPSSHLGSLNEILGEFSNRGITLISLSSRPLGSALGAYVYNFLLDGYLQDSEIQSALGGLIDFGCRLRVVGSFPVWEEDGVDGNAVGLDASSTRNEKHFATNKADIRTEG